MKNYDILRIGIVDGINEREGTIRAMFPDRDDAVINDIALFSFEQNLPEIDDTVLCLFLPNGSEQAFCLGPYFHAENPPPIKDEDMYVKKIDEELVIKYDYRSKQLTVDAVNEIQINGNIRVNGTIRSGGE